MSASANPPLPGPTADATADQAGAPRHKIIVYAIAGLGPVSSAGVQFALSLVLLRVLTQAEFGSFSFLLVASIFSWGIWSALFCAPLPILFHEEGGAAREATLHCLFSTNLVVATLAGIAFLAVALALGLSPLAATLAGAYAGIALLRWFARAYAYAIGRQLRTTASDLAYCLTLLVGVALVVLLPRHALLIAYGAMLAGVLAGLVPFGRDYLRLQFGQFSPSAIPGYAKIWRRFAGWSVLGVLTTETTANCHAYIITTFIGPSAFAPLAASALTMRPIAVAMNALTEFERAQMARQLALGLLDAAAASVRHFRLALIFAWICTVVLVLTLMVFAPRLVFPERYDLHFLSVGAALWLTVAGVRLLRTPESALLQAGGAFRPLALASLWSSGVSVVAVVTLLAIAGTLWSIVGILIGESIYALWVFRQTRRWKAERAAGAPA